MKHPDRNDNQPAAWVPLSRPDLGRRELEAVRSVFESGWVAGQGPACRSLEAKIRADTGLPYVLATNNCTAALHLSLLALGVGPGDEVLLSGYSFPATAHAVLYVGAKPVFVDVRPDTFNIDADFIEARITGKTKAMIVVHAFGQMVDVEPMAAIAGRHHLKIIEDAACAYGAVDLRGNGPGRLSDAVCFSFHARKNATGGEGGALATRHADLHETARSLSFFGIPSAYLRQADRSFAVPEFAALGYNYKLADILAAIIEVQLERLPDILAERRRLAERYNERLAGVAGIKRPFVAEGARPTWQSYVITLAPGIERDALIGQLRQKGIECQIGTYALHLQPVYQSAARCPVAADLFRRQVALPLFAGLTDDIQTRIVEELKEVLET